jgi:hypothetical protein
LVHIGGTDDAAIRLAHDHLTRMGVTVTERANIRIHIGSAAQAAREDWLLCDEQGTPLEYSRPLRAAVRSGADRMTITLADGEGRLHSRGVIGTRRSVAGTISVAVRVVGPLALLGATSPRAQIVQATGRRTAGLDTAAADFAGLVRFAGRLSRAAFTYREWSCAALSSSFPTLWSTRPITLDVQGEWQNEPGSRFWADPCLIVDGEDEWLFVEQLDRGLGRGHIVAVPVVAGRLSVSGARPVLSNEHHLSFPQIYRWQDRWLATVETCQSHNPVYEFESPGQPWRPALDLPALPAHLADPVVDWESGHLVATDGLTDPDSVLVRFTLGDGSWVPDIRSCAVDVGWSRGAGTWDTGRDIRAIQDCAGTYGRAVGLARGSDPHEHIQLWTARDLACPGSWRGIHSMTWAENSDRIWIDAWRRRFSVLGWRYRLTERRHLSSCEG